MATKIKTILTTVCFLCAGGLLQALPPHYLYEQLSNREGITNSSVSCIFEDSRGFMWFGTWDGLNRYDGTSFVSYKYSPNSANTLSNNVINNIYEEKEGVLWVETNHGVNRITLDDGRIERFYLGYDTGYPSVENAYSLAISRNGEIFCSCYEWGLARFDSSTDRFELLTLPKFSTFDIKKICVESNCLWILNMSGTLYRAVYTFHNHEIKVEAVDQIACEGLPIENIYPATPDHLFLVTRHSRVLRFDCRTRTATPLSLQEYPETSGRAHLKRPAIGKENRLYVTSAVYGVDEYLLTGNNVEYVGKIYNESPTLSTFVSSQEIVWVGTDGQGIYKIYPNYKRFNTQPNRQLGTNSAIRCFLQTGPSTLLVGTKGEGLLVVDRFENDRPQVQKVSVGDNFVYSMAKGFNNDLFVGSDARGLSIYTPSTGKTQQLISPDSLSQFGSVYAIVPDESSHTVWLGTSSYGLVKLTLEEDRGIYRIRSVKQFVRDMANPQSISNNVIYSIVDDGGSLWVGTRGGGLCRFDKQTETFTVFMHNPHDSLSLNNNDIISLTLDGRRRLWIGTSYGLNMLRADQPQLGFRCFTEKDGLSNNSIHGIIAEGNFLWLSTNKGISRFHTDFQTFDNFYERDGLQSDEFSDGACYAGPFNNLLFMGGIGGVTFFQPDQVEIKNDEYPLRIVKFSINNHDELIYRYLDPSEPRTLRLDWSQRFFSFQLRTLDYFNSDRCEYKYCLENFTNGWIHNGVNPIISFTNVPPGKYVLRMLSSNGDKVWSKNEYRLPIEINPPWWGSQWAYFCYFCLTLAILLYIYLLLRKRWALKQTILLERVETKHLQQLHEAKLRFFINIAHEFNSSLTLIYGPCRKLMEMTDNEHFRKYLSVIKMNTDRMINLIEELMEFRKVETDHKKVKPEKVDIAELIGYVSDNFAEIAEENKITYSTSVGFQGTWITDRDAVEKILFNLISNAFKYTPQEGFIRVKQYSDNGLLTLEVVNSGPGIRQEEIESIFDRFRILDNMEDQISKGKGNRIGVGMALTKGLITLLGGTIEIQSTENEQTTFKVSLPQLEAGSPKQNSAAMVDEKIAQQSEAIRRKQAPTLLIVDDEPDIRAFISDILSPFYQVAEAGNGLEALELMRHIRPTLIISDILMPDMDGLDFLKEIKSNQFTSHIPIIFLSSKSSEEDIISGYTLGADVYIKKPFSPLHLASVVNRMLDNHQNLERYYNSTLSKVELNEGVYVDKQNKEFILASTRLIESNIENDELDAEFICKELALSRMQFYRKIKEVCNQTPSEFIRTVKLNYAAKLLSTSDMTVQEVMFASGFNSKSYFYKEFAGKFGLSPKEYQNQKAAART